MRAACFLFAESEAGAVTVDWVVLAAAVVGLGVASVASVRSGTSALGTDIQTSLSSAAVVSLGTLGGGSGGGVVLSDYTYRILTPQLVEDNFAQNRARSDELLLTWYANHYDLLQTAVALIPAPGERANARWNLDQMNIIRTVAAERGLPLPGTIPDFDTVVTTVP